MPSLGLAIRESNKGKDGTVAKVETLKENIRYFYLLFFSSLFFSCLFVCMCGIYGHGFFLYIFFFNFMVLGNAKYLKTYVCTVCMG